jgi:hypothetical protein
LHRRIEVLEIATDVSGHIVIGPPKTSAGRRSVPVPRVVADALTDHLAAIEGEYVFPSPDGAILRNSLFAAAPGSPPPGRPDSTVCASTTYATPPWPSGSPPAPPLRKWPPELATAPW